MVLLRCSSDCLCHLAILDPSIGATGSPLTRMPAATDSQVPVHSQRGNATAATAGTSQPQLALAPSTSSSAAGPSHSSNAGPSTSSSTSLDTIDDVCNAIFTITVSGGDANAQYKLVSQSLLPALQHLDLRGTGQGVPGAVVLSSALQGNQDPLQALLTQIPPGGLGVGYLYILWVELAFLR